MVAPTTLWTAGVMINVESAPCEQRQLESDDYNGLLPFDKKDRWKGGSTYSNPLGAKFQGDP